MYNNIMAKNFVPNENRIVQKRYLNRLYRKLEKKINNTKDRLSKVEDILHKTDKNGLTYEDDLINRHAQFSRGLVKTVHCMTAEEELDTITSYILRHDEEISKIHDVPDWVISLEQCLESEQHKHILERTQKVNPNKPPRIRNENEINKDCDDPIYLQLQDEYNMWEEIAEELPYQSRELKRVNRIKYEIKENQKALYDAINKKVHSSNKILEDHYPSLEKINNYTPQTISLLIKNYYNLKSSCEGKPGSFTKYILDTLLEAIHICEFSKEEIIMIKCKINNQSQKEIYEKLIKIVHKNSSLPYTINSGVMKSRIANISKNWRKNICKRIAKKMNEIIDKK